MGFSVSTDGGRTFTYGGRVAPPPGWSIIWGDPSIGKVNFDDLNVYYAQLAGSTVRFGKYLGFAAAGDRLERPE